MLNRLEYVRIAKRAVSFMGMIQSHYWTLNSLMQFRRIFRNFGSQRNQFPMKNQHNIGLRRLASRELRRKINESINYYGKEREDGTKGDFDIDGSDDDSNIPIGNAQLLTPLPFPEIMSRVPLVVLHHSPLFPRFMKSIEVRHPRIIMLLRRKVRMNQPFVGLFLKKNDNLNDSVESLADIYEVGAFAHIHEMYDSGDRIRMTVIAHRRIRITGQIFEEEFIGKRYYTAPVQKVWDNDTYPTVTQYLLSRENETSHEYKLKLETVPVMEDEDEKLHTRPVLLVEVENFIHCPFTQTVDIDNMMRSLTFSLRELISINTLYEETVISMLNQEHCIIRNAVYLCDLAASLSSGEPAKLQEMLGEVYIRKRLSLAKVLLQKEIELAKLQQKIKCKIESNVGSKHRKFVLKEQMKLIQLELGIEKDEKAAVGDQYRERIQNKNVPEHIMSVIDEELKKLSLLDNSGSEFNVTRNYLDWLIALPWGLNSVENLDIGEAEKILDREHYGIEEAKRRILEFIAVSSLKGSTQGRILCFHGPPGIGKTSIARSIARALNREFFRFSVGGMSDVAEIKGHRRTYIGAMPGKLIQCLKSTQTENPLVLIDEIDKMGRTPHGDPCSALLELMDTEQNMNFHDFYLDVPVDLSRVLFISTANAVESIPEPLRDRMELIEMSGYIAEEKIVIARKYLIPVVMEECGLKDENICITDAAIEALIRGYCRESGVRNLQKHIDKIIRKVAFKTANFGGLNYIIDSNNLSDYVGKKVFNNDRMYMVTPPGVAMGLAWTSLGGTALYVETAKSFVGDNCTNWDGTIQFTGNLGDVMKESANIAMTVARNFLYKIDPGNMFLDNEQIHLHIPEGAAPKDGPSAGITIVSALISLAINREIAPHIAMTGEVSLKGRILHVGGIKEKTIAAKNCGVKILILPTHNKNEFLELPNFITNDLDVHFVESYDEVFPICFGDVEKPDCCDETEEKTEVMNMKFVRSITHKISNSISMINRLII